MRIRFAQEQWFDPSFKIVKKERKREKPEKKRTEYMYVTVKFDGADGARLRNNSAICVIVAKPECKRTGTNNARARRYCYRYEIVECGPEMVIRGRNIKGKIIL